MDNIERLKQMLETLYTGVEVEKNVFKAWRYENCLIGVGASELSVPLIDEIRELKDSQTPEEHTGWKGLIIIDTPLKPDTPLLIYATERQEIIVCAYITTPHHRKITLAEYDSELNGWYFRSASGNFVKHLSPSGKS